VGQNLSAMAREKFRAIPKNLIRVMPQDLKSKIISNYIRHITLKKYDVVHALAKKNNYHSYLEICTATTGNYYHKIDQSKFKKSFRLMYNCPSDFDDGLPIDYRHSGFDISSSIKIISENVAECKFIAHPEDCYRKIMSGFLFLNLNIETYLAKS
jgi:hypothetical protein